MRQIVQELRSGRTQVLDLPAPQAPRGGVCIATRCSLVSPGTEGLRLLEPMLGESVGVIGLGLIGQITVQILSANGCRVLGMDPDPARTALARRFGAATVELSRGEEPVRAAEDFSRGRGLDGVLVAAATSSDEPVSVAARMFRRRGRIVLIGV